MCTRGRALRYTQKELNSGNQNDWSEETRKKCLIKVIQSATREQVCISRALPESACVSVYLNCILPVCPHVPHSCVSTHPTVLPCVYPPVPHSCVYTHPYHTPVCPPTRTELLCVYPPYGTLFPLSKYLLHLFTSLWAFFSAKLKGQGLGH